MIDRLNTSWLRMSEKVAGGALLYARLKKIDRIFCGHTHAAMERERDGICYYNSGGWVDSKLTYITIDSDGVQIREYQHTEEPEPIEDSNMDSELMELTQVPVA
jgi:UDP-2,3-diacylglucosamine pyrophosphatase LpxH